MLYISFNLLQKHVLLHQLVNCTRKSFQHVKRYKDHHSVQLQKKDDMTTTIVEAIKVMDIIGLEAPESAETKAID